MLHFLSGPGPGKDNFCPAIHPVRQAVGCKETFYVDVFGADDKETAFFNGMCKDVIAGKPPVSHEDWETAINIAVNELADSMKFIFEFSRLENHIQKPLGKQVIQRNGMERVEASFRPSACRMEGGRVPRVPGNVKFTAVYGNEGILAPKPFCRETKVKLREDMSEGFGKELGPLLDEGGSRGDFIGKEIKIFQ